MAISIELDNIKYLITETSNKLIHILERNGKRMQTIVLPNIAMFWDDSRINESLAYAVKDYHNSKERSV